MCTTLVLLAVSLQAAGVPQGHASGSVLADPFSGAPVHYYLPDIDSLPYSGPQRLAIDSAGLVGNGTAYRVASHRLAGREYVFVEGWSGEGTGDWETAYWVFQVDSLAQIHPVLQVAAGEEVHIGPDQWSLKSCLVLAGDSLIGYMVSPRPRRHGAALPRSGYYSPAFIKGRFSWRAPADHALRRRCLPLRHGVESLGAGAA
jgi:hypothetical protein